MSTCSILDSATLNKSAISLVHKTKWLGYHPKKSFNGSVRADFEFEFKHRMEVVLPLLTYRSETDENKDQLTLSLRTSRPSWTPRVSLRPLFSEKRKRQAVSRNMAVDVRMIQELTLYWASALVLMGFRGVSDYHFLNKLKHEVEWLLSALGYRLVSNRILSCPFVIEWHDHPLWDRVCLADGASEAEVEFARSNRMRRYEDTGCSGYACTSSCAQRELLSKSA